MSKLPLFVGTTNSGKLEEFRLYLGGEIDILSPTDLGVAITVPEDDKSIAGNAERKAVMWSQTQQHPTMCDDTGFFIDALNGKPGVSVKTFGGELPENRTNEQWIAHLLERTKDIPTDCYFERIIVFAVAGNVIGAISDILHGTLSRERPEKVSTSYPLGDFFIPEGDDRVWSALSEAEQREYDSAVTQKLRDFISQHHDELWQDNQ